VKDVRVGDEIPIIFTITNHDQHVFEINSRADDRGGRIPEYELSATDAKGRPIEVIRIVQPAPRTIDGLPITPGYTNHYIANRGVVFPTYGIPEDEIARETLTRAHPGRTVVGVDSRYIEIGGGAVHCITQQRPVGSQMNP